jgi:hypothetical protein
VFATTLGAKQQASLHQCKDAPYSGATKGTMPSLNFYKIFQKSRQPCRDQSHERKVFWRKLDLEKSKDDGLRGVRGCYSFKAPSAHASAATARRLANTLRVPRSLSDLFSRSIRVTSWTLVRKMISQAKLHQVTSRTFQVLGGCERMVVLSGLRRLSLPTPMPPWL